MIDWLIWLIDFDFDLIWWIDWNKSLMLTEDAIIWQNTVQAWIVQVKLTVLYVIYRQI